MEKLDRLQDAGISALLWLTSIVRVKRSLYLIVTTVVAVVLIIGVYASATRDLLPLHSVFEPAGSESTAPGAPKSNSTLGFQQMIYINSPAGYNYDDAITLQSVVSDLEPLRFIGETVDTIRQIGLQPSRGVPWRVDSELSKNDHFRKVPTSLEEKVNCRTHSLVWREMLYSDWTTLLVLEENAMWDDNISQMMPVFAHGLRNALVARNIITREEATQVENKIESYLDKHGNLDGFDGEIYFPSKWDIINLGSCANQPLNVSFRYTYDDPQAPVFHQDLATKGEKPVEEGTRQVRFDGLERCTTAYAVSRRGALKLLSNLAIELTGPLDVAIQQQISAGELTSIAVYPPLFAQWEYLKELSPARKTGEMTPEWVQEYKKTKPVFDAAWKQSQDLHKMWDYADKYKFYQFKNPAMAHRIPETTIKSDGYEPL